MFVAGGQGGILIIDLNTQIIKNQFSNSGEVLSLAVTKNGQYLFFNKDSQLNCFHYNQTKNQHQQLSNAFYSQDGNSALEILLNGDESTLYAVGLYGTIAAYDIKTQSRILIGFTQVIDLNGLTIVRSYKVDQSQRNLLIVGRGAVIFKTRDAVITNDQNFVYVADNWNGLFIGNLTQFYQQVNQQLTQNSQYFQTISQLNNFLYQGFDLKECISQIQLTDKIRSYSNRFLVMDMQCQKVQVWIKVSFIFLTAYQYMCTKGDQLILMTQFLIYLIRIRFKFNSFHRLFINGVAILKKLTTNFTIFRAFDSSGQYINQINQVDSNYQLQNRINLQFDQYLVECLQFFVQNSKVYMFVSVKIKDEIMRVYDITNLDKVIILYGTSLEKANQWGILLCVMTSDNRWIIGTVRGYGVFAVDAYNKSKLILVDKLLTLGAKCLILLKYESNFAYLSDGMQGVAVVDLFTQNTYCIQSKANRLDELHGYNSKIQIQYFVRQLYVCWSIKSRNAFLDRYFQQSQYISHKFIQYEKQSSQSICLLNNQIQLNDQQISYESFYFIFINNNQGVYGLPLKTKILIHSLLIEVLINESGQTKYVVNNNTSDSIDLKIYVGQDIFLSLIPIYPILGLQIVELIYFTIELSQAGPLPSWFAFDQNQSKLMIKVDKNALGKDKTEGFQNVILIKIQLALNKLSFYYQIPTQTSDQSNITSQQESFLIFDYLVEQGYLYQSGTITSKFTLDTSFNFTLSSQNSKNKAICKRVQSTFLSSIFFNSIYIYAYSSLEFSLGQIGQNSNTFKYLSTKSKQQITFQIQIPPEIGKFLNIPYNGVVSSLNSNQSLLVIQGTLDSINLIFFSKIIFFCLLTEEQLFNTSYQVQIYINDQMNYPYNENLKFSDSSQSFLNVQKQIQPTQQQNSTLQCQFDYINDGSSIDITTYFKINFKANAFDYPQGFPQIQYSSLYNVNDGEYLSLLDHNFWLKSSVNVYDMSFFGTPPTTSFRDKICVNVTANNQYSQDSDFFVFIQIQFLSFIFQIQLLLYLDLYWEHQDFGNIEEYFLTQLLDAQKALLLFKYFINQYQRDFKHYNNVPNYLNKKNFDKQISQDLGQISFQQERKNIINTDINNQHIHRLKQMQDLHERETEYKKTNRIEYISSQIKSVSIRDIDNFSIIQKENNNQISNDTQVQQQEDPNLQVDQNQTKNLSNNFQSGQKQTKNKQDIKKKQKLLQLAQKKKAVINLIFQTHPLKDRFFQRLEQNFLKKNDQIKMIALINNILNKNIQFSILAQQITTESIKPDLLNKDTCLYNYLKYTAARYILSLDRRSMEVYQYIKDYSQNIFDCNQNDWYLSIIDIDPNVTQLDSKGNLIPFPKVQLKEDILNSIIIDKKLHNQFGQKFHIISICGVNPYLIENVLFADTLGILYEDPPLLYPSVGESLHLERQGILKVQAFKKIPSSYCMKIRKYLDMDYVPYSFQKINEIPNWLNLTISSDTLILEGIPQSQDLYNDVLIRIIHQDDYIIRQFHLQIRDKFDPKKHQFEEITNFEDQPEHSENN
ncbi:hypothetical protein ABPG72_014766 [Tetrahymena utriculariae]